MKKRRERCHESALCNEPETAFSEITLPRHPPRVYSRAVTEDADSENPSHFRPETLSDRRPLQQVSRSRDAILCLSCFCSKSHHIAAVIPISLALSLKHPFLFFFSGSGFPLAFSGASAPFSFSVCHLKVISPFLSSLFSFRCTCLCHPGLMLLVFFNCLSIIPWFGVNVQRGYTMPRSIPAAVLSRPLSGRPFFHYPATALSPC